MHFLPLPVAACLLATHAAAQPETPAQPSGQVEQSVRVVAPTPAPSADSLLTDLERAGADLRTLKADIRLTKTFSDLEGGRPQARYGTLYFTTDTASPPSPETRDPKPETRASPPTPRRKFQVDFTTLEVDGARRADGQTFVFDGEWLVEKNAADKQMIKRQVVAPGETVDPLAIGEGPFPLPIGQKKDKILERFEATNPAPADGFPAAAGVAPPSWLPETRQLRLVPKPGTPEARDFREVRIWYRASDLLPRLVRTSEVSGGSTEVFLKNMTLNTPLPPDAFDTTAPEDWVTEVTHFRKEADE